MEGAATGMSKIYINIRRVNCLRLPGRFYCGERNEVMLIVLHDVRIPGGEWVSMYVMDRRMTYT
jgi:hypothetical protein